MKDGWWQVFNRTIKFSRRKWSWERGCRLDGELEQEDGWGRDEGLQTGGVFVGPGWTRARPEASSHPTLTSTSTPKTTWGAVGWRPAASSPTASQKSKQPKVNNSWATSGRDGLEEGHLSTTSKKRAFWSSSSIQSIRPSSPFGWWFGKRMNMPGGRRQTLKWSGFPQSQDA